MISNGFYRNLAQKISENLLYHVDGRPASKAASTSKSSPSLKGETNPSSNHSSQNLPSRVRDESLSKKSSPNLAVFNIPSHLNTGESLDDEKHDESEVAMMSFILAGELKKFQLSMTEASRSQTVVNSSNVKLDELNQKSNLPSKDKEALSTSNFYICNVCGRGYDSLSAFDQHEINNHPNIICNYIEMKMEHNTAIALLHWINNSPMGLLKSCKVPGIETCRVNDMSSHIQCTKCGEKFSSVSSLHQHIMSCASFPVDNPIESTSDVDSSKPVTRAAKRETLRLTPIPFSQSKTTEKNKDSCNVESKKVPKKCTAKNNPRNSHLISKTSQKTLLSTSPEKLIEKSRAKSPVKIKSGPRARRRCPKCLRLFMYLRNFKRHLVGGCNGKKEYDHVDQSSKLSPRKAKIACDRKSSLMSIDDVECENSQNSKNIQSASLDEEVKEVVTKSDYQSKVKEGTDKNQKDSHKLDLWKVKEEYPLYAFKGSPAQHHSCPFCRRGFTYLANYRRHVKEDCPIKRQEIFKKQIKESFEKCLLKTKEALRKTWSQKIVIPSTDQGQ